MENLLPPVLAYIVVVYAKLGSDHSPTACALARNTCRGALNYTIERIGDEIEFRFQRDASEQAWSFASECMGQGIRSAILADTEIGQLVCPHPSFVY
jgi:hypothetical protein